MIKWLNFDGRINRTHFILQYILIFVFFGIFIYLANNIRESSVWSMAFLTATLIAVPYALSLYARRLHDLGKTGWLSLLLFIPALNALLFIYLLFFPGENKSNKFGPKS